MTVAHTKKPRFEKLVVRHQNRGVWHDTILGEATDGTLGCSVPLAAVLGKCTAQYRGLLKHESFQKSELCFAEDHDRPVHERTNRTPFLDTKEL